MELKVRYLSKSGNTKKLADAIAKQIGTEAKSITEPLEGKTDILFLGGAVYGFELDPLMVSYIQEIPPEVIKKVVLFSTAALVKSGCRKMRKELQKKDISVLSHEFNCPGEYLRMRKGRPDDEDIKNVEEFVQLVIKEEFAAQ